MTNIAAPSSEAISSYNAYKKLNLLSSAFVFYIPVFVNMDEEIINENQGVQEDTSNTKPSTEEIATMIVSAGLKATGEYLKGIKLNTDASTIKSQIEAISGTNTVIITDANNNTLNGKVGTGSKVKIKNSKEEKTYTVIIKGDTSGDGIINALDLLQVQKQILATYNLNDASGNAADTSGDGTINALDLLQIQKHILGTYTIEN